MGKRPRPLAEWVDEPPFGVNLNDFWGPKGGLTAELPPMFERPSHPCIIKPRAWITAAAARQPGWRVFDAFCGSGAAALALSDEGRSVIACELDPERYALAQANCRRFAVQGSVEVILASAEVCFSNVQPRVDWCYLDPPWGKDYLARETFGIQDYGPAAQLLIGRLVNSRTPFNLSVPLNFDFQRFREIVGPFWTEWHSLFGTPCAATVVVNQ